MVVQFIVFRTLLTLICRGTDISKCFSESLGIRANESRLYRIPERAIVNNVTLRNMIIDRGEADIDNHIPKGDMQYLF